MMNKRGMSTRALIIIFSIALAIALILALYMTFFSFKTCDNFDCFQKEMKECNRVVYINEEPEASWKYYINGEENDKCVVEVTLLQAKKGELGIDKLEGLSMKCSYNIGVANYPEKDLVKCSGKLREELQTIIINKLHSYILGNLGEFNESLQNLGRLSI
jgi:hypothetical protein